MRVSFITEAVPCQMPMTIAVIAVVFIARVTEYADHLHEHFVNPSEAENGAYKVPTVSRCLLHLAQTCHLHDSHAVSSLP